MASELINIVILSTLAGLATGLGGLLAVIKRPGKKLFGFLTGFAAGVMIVISFMGLVFEAWKDIGYLKATAGFAAGAIVMFLLDVYIPHIHFSTKETGKVNKKLLKTGILIALGITLHNIPEGISVGAGYIHLPEFGVLIAIAIALHNIPEGIATALPIYMSGASRATAVNIAFFSGMVEPIGALFAGLFLTNYQSSASIALAFAAGVMVFITLDELIPSTIKGSHEHATALGIIAGTISTFLLLGIFHI